MINIVITKYICRGEKIKSHDRGKVWVVLNYPCLPPVLTHCDVSVICSNIYPIKKKLHMGLTKGYSIIIVCVCGGGGG